MLENHSSIIVICAQHLVCVSLLVVSGDVHTNPGPTTTDNHQKDESISISVIPSQGRTAETNCFSLLVASIFPVMFGAESAPLDWGQNPHATGGRQVPRLKNMQTCLSPFPSHSTFWPKLSSSGECSLCL